MKKQPKYGDHSPNDFPMYRIRDASRYLKIPSATLRSWFAGTNRGKFLPVLKPAEFPPQKLSFNNLAEAFVLQATLRRTTATDSRKELDRRYARQKD